MNKMSVSGLLWHSFFRVHKYTFIQAINDRYQKDHECSYKYRYQGETRRVRCVKSPVYRFTKCSECRNNKRKICNYCRPKEYASFMLCDFCDIFYGVCKVCQQNIDLKAEYMEEEYMEEEYILNPNNPGKDYRKCKICKKDGCIKHFGSDKYCNKCYIKRYKRNPPKKLPSLGSSPTQILDSMSFISMFFQ